MDNFDSLLLAAYPALVYISARVVFMYGRTLLSDYAGMKCTPVWIMRLGVALSFVALGLHAAYWGVKAWADVVGWFEISKAMSDWFILPAGLLRTLAIVAGLLHLYSIWKADDDYKSIIRETLIVAGVLVFFFAVALYFCYHGGSIVH